MLELLGWLCCLGLSCGEIPILSVLTFAWWRNTWMDKLDNMTLQSAGHQWKSLSVPRNQSLEFNCRASSESKARNKVQALGD